MKPSPMILSLGGFSQAQFASELPHCIRNCIGQSQHSNCKATDIACLCRASAGNFLPDLATCMRGNCDLDASEVFDSVQAMCTLVRAPIPQKALSNAQDVADSVRDWISTVTETETEYDSTIEVAYPTTVWRTRTIPGSASTIFTVSTSAPSTNHSITASSAGTESQTSTTISSFSSSEATSASTTLAGAQTSSSATARAGQTKPPATDNDESNSSPFKNTNTESMNMREVLFRSI
ncbi:hypothetical protein B0O99DRAFT_698342 [Bisporella sp. PMI_857]|nr:hypothetical protein B0O99DRAFT_698342 [Bisporella sp. PMI_857]